MGIALDSEFLTRPMAKGSGRDTGEGVARATRYVTHTRTRLPRSVALSVELAADVRSYAARAFLMLRQMHQPAAPIARRVPATQLAKSCLSPILPTFGTLLRAAGKA